jgi:hypothetical protein
MFLLTLDKKQSQNYLIEKQNALDARMNGLEGRARVCARRASGLLAKYLLYNMGITPDNTNVLDNILVIDQSYTLDPILRNIFKDFTIIVDENHDMPDQIDLVTDLDRLEEYIEIIKG